MSTLNADVLAELLSGFTQTPRRLPSKYLYDDLGSRLFEAIARTEDYYLTRTELRLLRENAESIARRMKDVSLLLEFGAGSARKVSLILSLLPSVTAYLPIDISASALAGLVSDVSALHPEVAVLPICGDYASTLPIPPIGDFGSTGGLFLGSTIGNMERAEIRAFIENWRRMAGRNALGLIGVDLFKPASTLEAAYNDREGLTARFNLNLLTRLNRDLGSDFDPEGFSHRAVFNERESRIEMHLVSTRKQAVRLGNSTFTIEAGERIHTESCYKYQFTGFLEIIESCGSRAVDAWVDPELPYALVLIEI